MPERVMGAARRAEAPSYRGELATGIPGDVRLWFVILLAIQGFHLVEHVTQVVQRYLLGIPNGAGILGSVADIEPVHFLYNAGYFALLVLVCVQLGLVRDGPDRVGRLVFALLVFTLLFQGYHVVEHVAKLIQYLQLGMQNGTGGILGTGPGALAPLFPVPLLHLGYNLIAYLPVVLAFVLLLRPKAAPHAAALARAA
jgi:hypothetical protein